MTAFRVTATSTRQAWLQAVQTLQANLSRTQLQVSTGQRFSRPAEDPVAATRSLQLDGALQQTSQYARNAELARSRLSLEESTIGQIGGVLQRLRELAVLAANATQTNETRAAIGTEVEQQLDALVELANAQDGTGDYLFGGYKTRTQPFSVQAGVVTYNGDQGVRMLQIGQDRRIADGDSGAAVFLSIRSGNGTFVADAAVANTGGGVIGASSVTNPALYDGDTYTVTFTSTTDYEVHDGGGTLVTAGTFAPGQAIAFAGTQFDLAGQPAAGDQFTVSPSRNSDLFGIVQAFADALNTPVSDTASKARLGNTINRSIVDIDQGLGKMLEVRSAAGSRLSAIDAQASVNADVELNIKTLLSELRDLDYADALTRLQQQLTALEAAQASFARTQGLSLFNYF